MGELIALLLAAVSSLLGGGIADSALAQRIEQIVAQDPPVPVEAMTATCEDAARDGVGLIDFSFEQIYLEPLKVEHLDVGITRLSRPPEGKLSLESIAWGARITDDDLTAALRQENERFAGATVTVADGLAVLKGTYRFLGLNVPYEVEGTLSVENDSELMFHITGNRIANLRMPAGLNRTLEREVNPVYDLKAFAARSKKDMEKIREQLDYEFQVQVDELNLEDGLIIVSGTA